MRKIIGFGLIALGIFVELTWLGICFGSVIIGILLLIFAPRILFFPFNFFLILGIVTMNGKNYKYYSKYKQQGYNQHNYSNTQSSISDLDRYYEILESSKNDQFDTIKKNYRRLIKEYHYDSIASKGLPEDMLKYSEEKTKELNEAYGAIKKLNRS
ncbi:DnaJ domain-containing protein [Sulfurimonas sp.]|uniref:DnaJ domain-containing protein n=1 Tax=Sulfurimonas sp. TaxID=2022749 RepID=UPI0025E419C6|nr:DnaJ domain-containing protein [Sulfurimonas sp.]